MLARHATQIARWYGCGEGAVLRGPVARGEQGEVWCLTSSLGAWAVKRSFEPQSEADALADVAFQDAVRRAGVSAPRPVPALDGRVLGRLDGAFVRVYEWMELRDPDARLEPGSVGELVASIHGVRSLCERRPVDPWYSEPVGAGRWDELVVELTSRGAPFASRLAQLRDELIALEELLVPPRDLQVCHRDLWADNVRRDAAGALCVIDWESGGLADPRQELGVVLFEYGLDEPDRVRDIYDAYVSAGGPGRIECAGDFSMLIAQLGHVLELACTRWLRPDATALDRLRATDRIGEFLERPLTRRAISNLLDAATRS